MKIQTGIQLLLLLSVIQNFQPCYSMFEWLFGDGKGAENLSEAPGSTGNTIRFEVLSTDENFLDFANTLTDLSLLDTCYNLVIYNLKKKCGELSEEELGKLSVQLLNCQSEAENRPVFTCTSSMTLAECTKSMDGTTWNSYQIVGNRARAMCYSTQQLQFRRLTEATVNRLVSTAKDQVKSLDDLKLGQDQLHSLTSETVRKLYESQQDLLVTQNSLREAHDDIFKHIANNVKEIMQEKALIASGNRELASMTENIKDKLDSTAKQIQEREAVEHQKHERILQDLRDIQDNTETSIKKLDANLKNLMAKYEELDGQYSGMSSSLTKMNVTMSYVMSAVDTLSRHLDDRINWLSQLLGGADNKLSAMSCCLLHIAYFFLLAVTATFLQISLPARLLMMVVIVGNVAAELNYDHSFDFAGLTVFLCTVYFGFKFIVHMGERFSVLPRSFNPLRQSGLTQVTSTYTEPLSPYEMQNLLDLLRRLSETVSQQQNLSPSPIPNGRVTHDTSFRPTTLPSTLNNSRNTEETTRNLETSIMDDPGELRRTLIDQLGRGGSRNSSRASTPLRSVSRSSTPSISSRCLASTIAGTQCRLPASSGADFCRRHIQR